MIVCGIALVDGRDAAGKTLHQFANIDCCRFFRLTDTGRRQQATARQKYRHQARSDRAALTTPGTALRLTRVDWRP